MNVIGNIGSWIIENQYPIEIIIMLIFAAALILVIIRGLISFRRQKTELKNISKSVVEMEDALLDIKKSQNVILNNMEKNTDLVDPIIVEEKPEKVESTEDKHDFKGPSKQGQPKHEKSDDLQIAKHVREDIRKEDTLSFEMPKEFLPEAEKKEEILNKDQQTDETPSEEEVVPQENKEEKVSGICKGEEESQNTDILEEIKKLTAKQPVLEETAPLETRELQKPIQTEKYSSLDCGTDKFGRIHTEEELRKQIN